MEIPRFSTTRIVILLLGTAILVPIAVLAGMYKSEAALPTITISPNVPGELNPEGGGAPQATVDQAADFAWQEFIALNWPAGPQQGKQGQRDTASSSCRFGDPTCKGPTVWETFRGKVEIFPGQGNPPGYVAQGDPSYGYDALPQYVYNDTLSGGPINACDPSQASDPVPWVNLDEIDQITLDSMYAGVVASGSSPGNSEPRLIRFLAKANRHQYVYVAQNSSATDQSKQWWYHIPQNVVSATQLYLEEHQASPPSGSSQYVSLPDATIEMKAAWRPLNTSEIKSGHFHVQQVRFYENSKGGALCYRDAAWGLVALHIIQKTPSAPYFIYATFEQAENILTRDGKPVEDVNGKVIQSSAMATTPQVCLQDPRPMPTPTPTPTPSPTPSPTPPVPSNQGEVILTANPSACQPIPKPVYCTSPGSSLYYVNETSQAPSAGNICIDKRDNEIPSFAVGANLQAHAAIADYLKANKIPSAPWLYYKLVNVQYFPYDKVINTVTPNGSLYTSQPPYTAQNPAPSTFYQANIVVETNRALQLFSGGLSPNISTDWNADGTPHKNSYYGGKFYNMGGCMGCHGSQGQNPRGQAGDFSVILARGSVPFPEAPILPSVKAAQLKINKPLRRNRSLKR